jgi:hypothetical protein
MSKHEEYQKALDSICGRCFKDTEGHKKVLQELVDKATQKKVKEPKLLNGHKNTFIDGYCPNCNEHNFRCNKYCMHCGQKLDWSDKDE